MSGIELKKENLGPNPVADPPADWETLDWAATADEAKRSGVADADKRIADFRKDFYDDKIPKDHDQAIESYKKVQGSVKTCR